MTEKLQNGALVTPTSVLVFQPANSRRLSFILEVWVMVWNLM